MVPLPIPSLDSGQGISFCLPAALPLLSHQTRQPPRRTSRTPARLCPHACTRPFLRLNIAPKCLPAPASVSAMCAVFTI